MTVQLALLPSSGEDDRHEGSTGTRELRIRRVPLGLKVAAIVRTPWRCLFACPGYSIVFGYRASGDTCRFFWLSCNYFEETLGLRDGTLGLIEETPLKGSPRKSTRRPQAL